MVAPPRIEWGHKDFQSVSCYNKNNNLRIARGYCGHFFLRKSAKKNMDFFTKTSIFALNPGVFFNPFENGDNRIKVYANKVIAANRSFHKPQNFQK